MHGQSSSIDFVCIYTIILEISRLYYCIWEKPEKYLEACNIWLPHSHHNYQQDNVCLLCRFDWQCNVWLYWPVIHHGPLETQCSVCNAAELCLLSALRTQLHRCWCDTTYSAKTSHFRPSHHHSYSFTAVCLSLNSSAQSWYINNSIHLDIIRLS